MPGETYPGNSPFPLSITRGVIVTDFKVGKPAERPGTLILQLRKYRLKENCSSKIFGTKKLKNMLL